VLDDLKKIHERDGRDVLGAIANEWQQLTAELTCTPLLVLHPITNVVYTGMGGSTMAALLLSSAAAHTVPLEVVRDYEVPRYTNGQTLLIACSYSGNTEETVEALERGAVLGAQIAVMTGGGRLAAIAQERGYPLILLPPVEHARFAELYILNALVMLLDQAGVCTIHFEELAATAGFLQREIKGWLPTVPAKDNVAKQVAQECLGKSVVVYAGSKLAAAAYRWKTAVNESAKQVAWWNAVPEFNHNEFAGWSGQPEQKPYAVLELRSDLDHPRVQKRFEAADRLLSGMRPAPVPVHVRGQTVVEQLLWATVLGDFVGAYLALLSGVDPAPLAIVEKFKHAMGGYDPRSADSNEMRRNK
jgi:glucose/mannose-6-phosphate isomerase